MATIAFVYTDFTAQFPQFATSPTQAVLQVYFNLACNYVSPIDTGGSLNTATRTYALYLVTAHIAQLMAAASTGGSSANGPLTSASVKDVSYTVAAPPTKSLYDYWFSRTGYGQAYLALLSLAAVGGLGVYGGYSALLPFRTGDGTFPDTFCTSGEVT